MENKEQEFLRKWINSQLAEKGRPVCIDAEFKKAETSFFVFYRRERNHIDLARRKALFDLIERREKNE